MPKGVAACLGLWVAAAWWAAEAGAIRLGDDRPPPPEVRSAAAKARAERLKETKRCLIAATGPDALAARLFEDCLAEELLAAGVEVVSRLKAERLASELLPALAPRGQDPAPGGGGRRSAEADAARLRARLLPQLAKRAEADTVCDGTLYQEERLGEGSEGIRGTVSLILVDATTEEVLWAGLACASRPLNLPLIAKDLVAKLCTDMGRK